MRKAILAATMALAAMPGIAAAAEPPCLTPAEFTSLAGYALPSIITGTSERCAAALPPTSFLRSNGASLADRYAARKPAQWPGAKAAFLKLSGGTNKEAADLIRNLPDPTLQQMFDALMQGMIGQQIPTERCGTIDSLVRLLAPLPPENTAELIALAAGLGSKAGQPKVGAIAICRT